MNMKKIPFEFEKLLKQAKEVIQSDSTAEQAVVVWTSKGNMFYFANHDVMSSDTKDENIFMNTLAEKEDTEIKYLVCMWNDNTLDILSFHLRNLLVDLNPSNKEIEILLGADEGFQVKSLKIMIP